MKTLLRFDEPEPDLCRYFRAKCNALKQVDTFDSGDISMYRLSDGIVYHYDGMYSFAYTGNKIYRIFLTDFKAVGISVINIKDISVKKKRLLKELGLYFKQFDDIIKNESLSNVVTVIMMQDHSCDNMQETIIQQHTEV